MSCEHPYDCVTEEHIQFKFDDHDLSRADSPDPVRVAVKFCTECSHIIDSDSFDESFPITHLNELIQVNDTCEHPYKFVTDERLSFTLEDKPMEPDKASEVVVKLCENCSGIIEREKENIPILTTPY